MMTDIEKALVGKTIAGFTLADDGNCITFDLADGTSVTLDAEGDCCSTSWIESIDDESALIGTVQSVKPISMPYLGDIDGKRHKGVDEVKYYGLKITTDKGRAVIDYRNDSNGFYGGSLELRYS